MATIAENLLELQQTKENFKTAFAEKEVDLTGVPFTEYPNKFSEIKTSENLDTELTAQDEELAGLEAEVNALEDKPKSDIQYMIDQSNSCAYLFSNYSGTDLPFISGLDTSNATSMESMFYNCKNLTSLDVNNFDTKNVTSMNKMFLDCPRLTELDLSNFDTSNVTSMQSMFYGCENLTSFDLSNFNTSNVTDTGYMFNNCTGLTSLDVSSFDTSNVTVMSGMFYGCENLQTLNLFPLELKRGDKIDNMFQNCKNLTNIDLSNWTCTNWAGNSNIFMNCSSLVEIDLSPLKLENSKVFEGALAMFSGCTNLKKIKGVLNFYGQSYAYNTGAQNIFLNCVNLEEVTLMNIKQNLILGSGTSYGTKITNATLINTIQQLWDYSGTSTTKTLTLSTASKNNIANIYVKLIDVTEEMLAEDQYAGNKKPCVVCEPTDEGAMTLTEYATSKNWAIA